MKTAGRIRHYLILVAHSAGLVLGVAAVTLGGFRLAIGRVQNGAFFLAIGIAAFLTGVLRLSRRKRRA